MSRIHFQVLVLLVAFAFGTCGCGERADLGSVTGTIKLDGEPLENAMVEFVPQGTGSTSYGRTDSSGAYKMMFTRDTAGASPGDNLVKISTGDVAMQDGKEVAIPEVVPAKYNRQSELVRTVELGKNVFDFDLESEGKIIQLNLGD